MTYRLSQQQVEKMVLIYLKKQIIVLKCLCLSTAIPFVQADWQYPDLQLQV